MIFSDSHSMNNFRVKASKIALEIIYETCMRIGWIHRKSWLNSHPCVSTRAGCLIILMRRSKQLLLPWWLQVAWSGPKLIWPILMEELGSSILWSTARKTRFTANPQLFISSQSTTFNFHFISPQIELIAWTISKSTPAIWKTNRLKVQHFYALCEQLYMGNTLNF